MIDQIAVDPDLQDIVALAIERYGLTQLPTEFGPFLQLVRELQPRTVVEVGTDSGASIWAIGQACAQDTLLISLDISDPTLFHGPFADQVWISTQVWRLPRPCLGLVIRKDRRVYHRLIADSQQEASRRLVEALMQLHHRSTIDLLFLDGDHSEWGVRRDFELFSPLVREGGLVALHDIADNEWTRSKGNFIYPLWNDLQSAPGWEAMELKDRSDTFYYGNPAWKEMGIGIVRKLPGQLPERAQVSVPWLRWTLFHLGHLSQIIPQYGVHLIGGLAKRLLRRQR